MTPGARKTHSPTPPDDSIVLIDGPWTHRTVRANGIALHAVEAGSGPLVLLLHGFPQFWWTWRHQLSALAEAGFRAVAIDLRGFGASDKTPRGYDTGNLTADATQLITALGEREAVVVGNDLGGMLAWTAAHTSPAVVRRIVVVGAAHPLQLRRSIVTDLRGQARASAYFTTAFQVPRRPEARLRDDAIVEGLFAHWSGPAWRVDPEYAESVDRYVQALRIVPVAHLALENFRWQVRSMARSDGRRFTRSLSDPITVPVLQIHGAQDTCILPRTARGSAQHVGARYEWRLLPGVGHFPQEESPDLVSQEIIRWASS
jgi:pimeloyl-ACP methyl ester carboxylesterase